MKKLFKLGLMALMGVCGLFATVRAAVTTAPTLKVWTISEDLAKGVEMQQDCKLTVYNANTVRIDYLFQGEGISFTAGENNVLPDDLKALVYLKGKKDNTEVTIGYVDARPRTQIWQNFPAFLQQLDKADEYTFGIKLVKSVDFAAITGVDGSGGVNNFGIVGTDAITAADFSGAPAFECKLAFAAYTTPLADPALNMTFEDGTALPQDNSVTRKIGETLQFKYNIANLPYIDITNNGENNTTRLAADTTIYFSVTKKDETTPLFAYYDARINTSTWLITAGEGQNELGIGTYTVACELVVKDGDGANTYKKVDVTGFNKSIELKVEAAATEPVLPTIKVSGVTVDQTNPDNLTQIDFDPAADKVINFTLDGGVNTTCGTDYVVVLSCINNADEQEVFADTTLACDATSFTFAANTLAANSAYTVGMTLYTVKDGKADERMDVPGVSFILKNGTTPSTETIGFNITGAVEENGNTILDLDYTSGAPTIAFTLTSAGETVLGDKEGNAAIRMSIPSKNFETLIKGASYTLPTDLQLWTGSYAAEFELRKLVKNPDQEITVDDETETILGQISDEPWATPAIKKGLTLAVKNNARPAPAMPTNVTATWKAVEGGDTGILVEWETTNDFQGYELQLTGSSTVLGSQPYAAYLLREAVTVANGKYSYLYWPIEGMTADTYTVQIRGGYLVKVTVGGSEEWQFESEDGNAIASEYATAAATVTVPALNPTPEVEPVLAVASNLGYTLYKTPRMKEVVTGEGAQKDTTYVVEDVYAVEFYWSATNSEATAEQLAAAQFELVVEAKEAGAGARATSYTTYVRGNKWLVYVDETGLANGTYTWKVRGVVLNTTVDNDNVSHVTIAQQNDYVAAAGAFAELTIPFTVAEEEYELRWYTGDVVDLEGNSSAYEAATEIDITDGYENLYFIVELAAKNAIGTPSQPLPEPGDYPADPDNETLGGEGQTEVTTSRMAREGEEEPDPSYGGMGEDPGFELGETGYNVVARVRVKNATTYLDTVTLVAYGNDEDEQAVVFAYTNEAFYDTKVEELEAGEYEIEFMVTKGGLIIANAQGVPTLNLKHNFKLIETEESNEIEIVETTHGKDQLRFDTAKFSMLVYGLEEETYGEDYAVQVTITASNVEGFETIDTVILTEAALNPFKLALKDGEYHFYAVVVEKDNNKWVEKQDADNGPYFISFDFRMGLPAVDEDQIKAFVGGDDVTFNWKGEEGFWYEFVVTTGGEDIRFFVLADEETESENGGYAYTIENNAAGTYTWKMRCVQLTVSDAEIALGVIMDQDNSINPVRTSGWANGNAFALPASVVTVLSESDADLFSVTELTSGFTPVTVKANYAADEFDGLTYSDAEPVIGVKVSNALFAGDYTTGTPNISYKMFVEKGTLAKQDLTTLSYAAPLLTEDEFMAAMVEDFEGFTEPGLWTVFFSLTNLNTLDGALSTLGELDEEDVEAADRDYVLSFVFYDAEGNELPVLNNPAVFEFSVGEFVEPVEKAAAPENFRISKIEITPANEEEETAEEATITFKWDNKVYVTGAIWYGETKVRDIKPYAEKQASYNIDEEYNYSQYKGKELTYKVRGCKYENYALVEGSESEEEIVGTFILKDSVNPNEPVVEEPVFAITINGETSAYDEDWMSFMLTASGNAEPTIHYTATGFGEDLNGYKITYNVILNGGGEGGIEMKEAEEEEDFFYVEGEITNLSENGSFQLSQAMPEGEYRITISLEDEFGPVQNMETWDEYTVYVTYTSDGTGATPAPEYDITVYYGETELYEYYDLYGGVRPTFGFEISNFDKVPAGAKVGMAIEDDDEIYYKYTSVPAAAEGTISAVEDLTSDVYFYYVWITVVEEDETTANPLIDGIIFWYTVTPGSGTLVKAPELKGVNVYPNPAKGQFNVSVPEKANVAIYNANGQVVAREANVSGVRNYNLTTSGVYFVRVIANGQATVKRVVIR